MTSATSTAWWPIAMGTPSRATPCSTMWESPSVHSPADVLTRPRRTTHPPPPQPQPAPSHVLRQPVRHLPDATRRRRHRRPAQSLSPAHSLRHNPEAAAAPYSGAALGTLTILGVHRVLEHALVHVHCALPPPAGRPDPIGRRDEVPRTSRASDETRTIWAHTFLEPTMNARLPTNRGSHTAIGGPGGAYVVCS